MYYSVWHYNLKLKSWYTKLHLQHLYHLFFCILVMIFIFIYWLSTNKEVHNMSFTFLLSFPQEIGKSEVGLVRQIPRAIEVLHKVLNTDPLITLTTVIPSGLTEVWGRKGKPSFQRLCYFLPASLSSILQGGFLFYFLFSVVEGAWLCIALLHHWRSAFGSVYPLEFGSRRGQQRIKQRTREVWNENVLADVCFFGQRNVFTWCTPCMSSAAILFYIISCYTLLILFSLTSIILFLNLWTAFRLWFFSPDFLRSIYLLLLLPWELKRQQNEQIETSQLYRLLNWGIS